MKTLPLNNVDIRSSLDQEIIVLTLTSVVRLYDINADAANLYLFYCKNAKLQANLFGYTNTIRADDIFCMKGLHWGKEKFYRTKKILQHEGFIEEVTRRKADGTIDAHYVQVNFLLKSYNDPSAPYKPQSSKQESGETKNEKLASKQPRNHSPQNQRVVKPDGGFQETNADNKNINTDNLHPRQGALQQQSDYRPKKADSNKDMGSLPYSKIWEIAMKKNVSVADVQAVQQQVLDSIADGNKYKTKSVNLTVQKWIGFAMQRGQIQQLGEMGRMILESDSPEKMAAREKIFAMIKKGEIK